MGRALCDLIVTEYEACVASKGSFSFAISGGSMLKMLGLLDGCVRRIEREEGEATVHPSTLPSFCTSSRRASRRPSM